MIVLLLVLGVAVFAVLRGNHVVMEAPKVIYAAPFIPLLTLLVSQWLLLARWWKVEAHVSASEGRITWAECGRNRELTIKQVCGLQLFASDGRAIVLLTTSTTKPSFILSLAKEAEARFVLDALRCTGDRSGTIRFRIRTSPTRLWVRAGGPIGVMLHELLRWLGSYSYITCVLWLSVVILILLGSIVAFVDVLRERMSLTYLEIGEDGMRLGKNAPVSFGADVRCESRGGGLLVSYDRADSSRDVWPIFPAAGGPFNNDQLDWITKAIRERAQSVRGGPQPIHERTAPSMLS